MSEPVRIVLAVTASRSAALLRGQLAFLRESGFEVFLMCSPGHEAAQVALSDGVTFLPVPLSRRLNPVADVYGFIATFLALLRVRPTIVSAGTPKAAFVVLLAAALSGVKRRVYFVRGLRLETASGVIRRLMRTAERLTAWMATDVVCVSASLRDQMMAERLVPPSKALVLGRGSSRGVDVSRFSKHHADGARSAVRSSLGIPLDAFVVGFVGRVVPDKGVAELVDAWRAFRDAYAHTAYLLLVGDVDKEGGGVELGQWLRDDSTIRCVGRVHDPVPYYACMDVLVHPSHREGFPNVLLEAAAMELPVVTTDATGCRDAVVANVTGLVVPVSNSGALADAMLRYANDSKMRLRHGRAGRCWVVDSFRQEDVWARQRDYYRKLSCIPR